MCGISGWQLSSSLIQEFNPQAKVFSKAQEHRGPDSSGSFHSSDEKVYLGHNRLSIIDLSHAANQPMLSDRGDAMIFNGEIYNFQSVKLELQAKGHTFSSESDSEVILKAYLEWGTLFTEKLHGMYAIAIWDANAKTLHLFRDPLGIKPLYYWTLPNQQGVVFASELKSFLSIDSFKYSINKNSLSQFIEFGYSIDKSDTIFNGVKKLQPGHRIEICDCITSEQKRFYSPDLSLKQDVSIENIEDTLYTTLSTVIKEHLIADVPLGLLLSGGLDSSIIAAIASQQQKIHTFSMGFSDSDFDERPYAKMVSEKIGSIHKEITISPEEVMNDLQKNCAHYDDVFADWGMISTRILYSKCKEQGIKVVLVGEGSDELFGGYDIFKQSLNNTVLPMEIKLFQLYRQYSGRRYGQNYGQFRSQMKTYLSECQNDLFSAIRLFETRNQIPNNYVMKVDKASMAVSLEARTPFLDSRIANIAYQLPKEILINSSDEKLILKSMAKRYQLLPDEILNRRKFGSGINTNWMESSTSFRKYAQDIILSPNSWVDHLNLRDAMQRYFYEHQQGYSFPRSISIFRNLAWRLLILSLWGQSLGVKP